MVGDICFAGLLKHHLHPYWKASASK